MTKSQKAVLDALDKYGPIADHALVPIMQHEAGARMSSSSIRSRRAELTAEDLVGAVGTVKMPSGRHASVWAVL